MHHQLLYIVTNNDALVWCSWIVWETASLPTCLPMHLGPSCSKVRGESRACSMPTCDTTDLLLLAHIQSLITRGVMCLRAMVAWSGVSRAAVAVTVVTAPHFCVWHFYGTDRYSVNTAKRLLFTTLSISCCMACKHHMLLQHWASGLVCTHVRVSAWTVSVLSSWWLFVYDSVQIYHQFSCWFTVNIYIVHVQYMYIQCGLMHSTMA